MSSRHDRRLEHLPQDWGRAPLGQLGQICSGSTPSRAVASFWGGDIPWVTPGELTKLGTKYLNQTAECITASGLAGCSATLVPKDTLLVTTRATLGAIAMAGMSVATNQGFRSIRFCDKANPHFYYHFFPLLVPELTRRASGTTFPEISGKQFAAIVAPIPGLPEQTRIASIFDTLDDTIRHTEQVIDKLQQMKQGLLHDLLTRGIDENGEVRDPLRCPELFKESVLGRIPASWAVRRLSDSCDAIVDCPHSTPTFLTEGVLVARTMQIKGGRYDEVASSRVSEREYRERIARLRPQTGDVIFTREAPVGEAFAIPDGMRICLGQRVMLLRPAAAHLLGDYLVAELYSVRARRRIDQLTGGTTNPHLNVKDLRAFPIALPPVGEQASIVRAISGITSRIESEVSEARKLGIAKQGLMDDLLTGRVRTAQRSDA